MKTQYIKNLRTKVIFISLAILSFFLLIINFIPLFGGNIGITTKYLRELEVDRLTHVDQSNPDVNYFFPSSKNTEFGNSCEVFIHYNLAILPKETEALHLVVASYSLHNINGPDVEDVELNLILIESNLNYSEITWNNKPNHEEIIDNFNMSEITQHPWEEYDLEQTIDLTEIFEEKQLSEIAFCINITENNPELDYYIMIGNIRLLYTYNKFIISYTTIISSILVFSTLIGTLYFIKKDLYFCPKCGNKIRFDNRLCRSCENTITNDVLIRGLYYHRLIILIWILIFIEGLSLLLIFSWIVYSVYIQFFLLLFFLELCYFPIIIRRNIKRYKKIRKIID